MYENSDRLLFVLSGRGKMGWQSFKSAFDTLLRQAVEGEASLQKLVPRWALLNCVRTLEGMGHCDFDFDQGNAVFIAPPVLARLPRSGLAVAVLTGGTDSKLHQARARCSQVEPNPRKNHAAP